MPLNNETKPIFFFYISPPLYLLLSFVCFNLFYIFYAYHFVYLSIWIIFFIFILILQISRFWSNYPPGGSIRNLDGSVHPRPYTPTSTINLIKLQIIGRKWRAGVPIFKGQFFFLYPAPFLPVSKPLPLISGRTPTPIFSHPCHGRPPTTVFIQIQFTNIISYHLHYMFFNGTKLFFFFFFLSCFLSGHGRGGAVASDIFYCLFLSLIFFFGGGGFIF